jgi:1-acyl-sn-glycerol-3-phosphate acyltransferase
MSLAHLGHAAVQTLRICAPTVVQAAVGTLTSEMCDARLDDWSKRIIGRAHIELSVEGLENAPPGEAFVVMSNHQSLYDIPVLFQALKRRVRMVAKRELFRIPLFAHAMRIAGFVEVDRANRERAIASLRAAEAALHGGTSIWIAPEGTRSETGRLGAFKKGGFHMALATGTRILPISIIGTRDTLLARGWRVRDGARAHVIIGQPIDPKAFGNERRDELMDAVHRAIAIHLPAEREASEAQRTGAAASAR